MRFSVGVSLTRAVVRTRFTCSAIGGTEEEEEKEEEVGEKMETEKKIKIIVKSIGV